MFAVAFKSVEAATAPPKTPLFGKLEFKFKLDKFDSSLNCCRKFDWFNPEGGGSGVNEMLAGIDDVIEEFVVGGGCVFLNRLAVVGKLVCCIGGCDGNCVYC